MHHAQTLCSQNWITKLFDQYVKYGQSDSEQTLFWIHYNDENAWDSELVAQYTQTLVCWIQFGFQDWIDHCNILLHGDSLETEYTDGW